MHTYIIALYYYIFRAFWNYWDLNNHTLIGEQPNLIKYETTTIAISCTHQIQKHMYLSDKNTTYKCHFELYILHKNRISKKHTELPLIDLLLSSINAKIIWNHVMTLECNSNKHCACYLTIILWRDG